MGGIMDGGIVVNSLSDLEQLLGAEVVNDPGFQADLRATNCGDADCPIHGRLNKDNKPGTFGGMTVDERVEKIYRQTNCGNPECGHHGYLNGGTPRPWDPQPKRSERSRSSSDGLDGLAGLIASAVLGSPLGRSSGPADLDLEFNLLYNQRTGEIIGLEQVPEEYRDLVKSQVRSMTGSPLGSDDLDSMDRRGMSGYPGPLPAELAQLLGIGLDSSRRRRSSERDCGNPLCPVHRRGGLMDTLLGGDDFGSRRSSSGMGPLGRGYSSGRRDASPLGSLATLLAIMKAQPCDRPDCPIHNGSLDDLPLPLQLALLASMLDDDPLSRRSSSGMSPLGQAYAASMGRRTPRSGRPNGCGNPNCTYCGRRG